jgi:hypothetical protein
MTSGRLGVLDTTTGQPVSAVAQRYTGPVANLQEQFIDITGEDGLYVVYEGRIAKCGVPL